MAAAEEVGVSREGPDPSEEKLSRLVALSRSGPRKKATPAEDLLEPWGDQIYRWVTVDRLQVTRIGELLASEAVRCPTRRCGVSCNGATGDVAAPERCGWSRAGLERWRNWTSAA